MDPEYHRLLLIFVDGVGLAPASSHNPLSTCSTPAFDALLGGSLTLERCQSRADLLLAPIDANLGVGGLPQSATGQAALFTGINAAERFGRHLTGLPGPRIRGLVDKDNLLKRAVGHGLRSTFANPYSQAYLDAVAAGDRRPSVTTCAVASAELEFRRLEDLQRNQAVSWDIIRDRFAEQIPSALSRVTARQAGEHLAQLANAHRLTIFETFISDLAGHGRMGYKACDALERIDGLVAGVLASMSSAVSVLLTSDHGNLEDGRHRRHTRNTVPLLVAGPLAPQFADARSILDVTPRILTCLQATEETPGLALGPGNLL